MPRLYELRDLIDDPTSPDAYFQNFESHIRDSAHVREIYLGWENELQGLDKDNWKFLKSEASRYLVAKNEGGRGWHQLFHILNQAHAYNYLKALGCTDVRFIPQCETRTPDLEAWLDSARVLCEVKTINISESEVRARQNLTVRNIAIQLDQGFFGKLASHVSNAKNQLCAYDPSHDAQHYIYINLCFDDFLGEHKELYFGQIDRYLSDNPVPGSRLVFRNDRTPFHKPLSMANASVDNAC